MPRRPSAWGNDIQGYTDSTGAPLDSAAVEAGEYFVKGDEPRSPRSGEQQPRSPQKKTKSLYDDILAVVASANEVMAQVPPLADDRLTEQEATMLARAADNAQQRNPTMRKYFGQASERGGVLMLVAVGVLIALPRLARHGLLPFKMPALPEVAADEHRNGAAPAPAAGMGSYVG